VASHAHASGAGEYDVASELGRTIFEHAPSSIPGDLHDSISLLWRLELLGRDVAERWKPFARIAAERLDRQALLFHAAHLAMALAASGDWTTAERQLGMLRDRSARDRTGLVGASWSRWSRVFMPSPRGTIRARSNESSR